MKSDNDSQDIVPTDNSGGALAIIGGWLSNIPKILQKPLAKAAGRLITGLVEVPAAALEAKAKDIKHAQATKQKIRTAIAEAAAANLSKNPELIDRATDYFVNQVIQKQQNREEVLRSAVEELARLPSDLSKQQQDRTGENLDDDWLNGFVQYAETASSERMRTLFGRVLAGEIRRPGTYSLFTIDFLSKLDQTDAVAITEIAPFVLDRGIILTAKTQSILTFDLSSKLGSLGILTSTSIGIASATMTIKTFPNLIQGKYSGILRNPKYIFYLATDTEKDLTFPCSVLTRVGREILNLHCCDLDPIMLQEYAAHLEKQDAELYMGEIPNSGESKIPLRKVIPKSDQT